MALENLYTVQALIQHGYPVKEAQDTVNYFAHPPQEGVLLNDCFFAGMNKTLDAELTAKLFSICPAEKVTFASVPSQIPVEEWLTGMNEAPNMKKLCFERCKMTQDSIKGISRMLVKGNLKELRLAYTNISAYSNYFKNFTSAVSKSRLETLEMYKNSNISETNSEELVDAVQNTGLKHLDLTGAYISSETLKKLPLSLESLSLPSLPITMAPRPELTERILLMPGLKELDIEKNMTTQDKLADFFEKLPQTKLEKINLYKVSFLDDSKINDEMADILIASMKHPSCMLYETGLTHQTKELGRPLYDISPEKTAKIEELEKLNYTKLNISKDQSAARQAYSDGKDDLFTTAKAGKIGQTLKNRPISVAEYTSEDNQGKTLITHIAEAQQIDLVFEPKYWTNPKEMQTVWEAVPDCHRWQMDGKQGRQSYIKNKSQVMANAVKTSMAVKNKTR